MPDIDLDFPREIREQLIARVYEVYGEDRAALVCAFSTYQLRSAVRDVGKVLGHPAGRSRQDRKAERASTPPPSSRRSWSAFPPTPPARTSRPGAYLIELAEQLAGFPRHITQHSGGMIVSSPPLIELVPIQPAAMEGRFLCQWDKDSCDDARFVKIDFLALGMLSLVEECLELIRGHRQTGRSQPDRFRRRAVYEMICAGDTIGVFQIESRAQIQMLPRTQPRNLEDLVVQVAIVRPVRSSAARSSPTSATASDAQAAPTARYDHPLLEPVLARPGASSSSRSRCSRWRWPWPASPPVRPTTLRRAMSRKRSEEAMMGLWEQFRQGAESKGVAAEIAQNVFAKLMRLCEVRLPEERTRPRSRVLAYQSCWLKPYYPAEFLCALLNNQPMGFYPSHVWSTTPNATASGCATGHQRQRLGLLGRTWPGSADRPRIRQGIAGGRRRHHRHRTGSERPLPLPGRLHPPGAPQHGDRRASHYGRRLRRLRTAPPRGPLATRSLRHHQEGRQAAPAGGTGQDPGHPGGPGRFQ